MPEQLGLPNPVVSIGMPVYNGEKYIKMSLDSLLAQTFTDFELIISDNASTDSTSAICREYALADARIRYIRQPKNCGPLANFQFVLDEATGPYFMWAACDDRWDADWIKQLQLVLAAAAVEAAFGQVAPIDENSRPIDHVAVGKLFGFTGRRLTRKLRFYLAYEGAGKANVIYALFRRSALKCCSLNKYRYDYHIVFDLLENAAITAVPGPTLYKRIHADSIGESGSENRNMFFRIVGRLLKPMGSGILTGYFTLSSGPDKLALALALPLKYMFAYGHFFQTLTRQIIAKK